jgi:hypothetical protein
MTLYRELHLRQKMSNIKLNAVHNCLAVSQERREQRSRAEWFWKHVGRVPRLNINKIQSRSAELQQ